MTRFQTRGHRNILVGVLLLTLAFTAGALAQANPDEQAPALEEPGDPLGRDTPLGSITGFIKAADTFEWELATQYLDLRNLPPGARQVSSEDMARQLYFILQRREIEADRDLISDRPEGFLADDLPDYRDHLAQLDSSNGPVNLLMQRVPGPDGEWIWKVSNQTMAVVPQLYEEFSYPDWVERIRLAVPGNRSLLGIELFKWVIVLGALFVLLPVGWVLFYLLARVVSSPKSPLWPELRGLLTGPVLGLTIILILRELIYELGVGATASKIVGAHTIQTFLIVWFVWKGVDLWRARRRLRYESEGRSDAAVLGRPLANAIKLLSVVMGLLVWLANMGIDITALLTGLGIGGIAVALALQKPIEDLFGAVSIYSQQPVSTGDLCRYGDTVGVVEEIGLRTTRIRTLSNSLINVPNAQLASGIIENLTARTKIIYEADLSLRYDATRSQLEGLLAALTDMLRAQPLIEDNTVRVRLQEFSPNAIIVRIRVFALTRDFEEYLETVQTINLEVLKLMADHGVSFSQGAQTVFLTRGVRSDGEPVNSPTS